MKICFIVVFNIMIFLVTQVASDELLDIVALNTQFAQIRQMLGLWMDRALPNLLLTLFALWTMLVSLV